MGEMVERVIAAVMADLKDQLGGKKMHDPNAPTWTDWSADGNSIDVERCVRAAIAAMREPTDAMEDAGFREIGEPVREENAAAVWRAMIDEALE
jgi:hypothetical protein